MINDFITREDLSLFFAGTRLILASAIFNEGRKDDIATFDLLVRELPKNRNYLVFAGLEHAIDFLLNLKFTKKQISWLNKTFKFAPEFISYLEKFRFTGDVWAMPEGTMFFPNEPVIRVSAPMIQASLIEYVLMNNVYLQTILASKFSRFVNAANGKEVVLGFNRSYGIEGAMKGDRVKEIIGATGNSCLYNLKYNKSPFSAGTFHYFIMLFENELAAFRAYLKHAKGKGYVLVDTYESIQGIKNFITAAKELEKFGLRAFGIQLDSGDLYQLSVSARKMFDQAGLNYLKIFAMSNLDEWKVAELERKNAPIDVYCATTSLVVPEDAPTLELVYKLSEVIHQGKIIPKMKTSTKKISLPGRKQVFRVVKDGKYQGDIIGLENDKIKNSEKLLQPIIKSGKLVRPLPNLSQIRKNYLHEQKGFNKNLFDVYKKSNYQVKISPAMRKLAAKIKKEIEKI